MRPIKYLLATSSRPRPTSLEGRMLIVSYNCMPARQANCADLGNRVIESLQVKGR